QHLKHCVKNAYDNGDIDEKIEEIDTLIEKIINK
ncbi:MAG TPA: transcriptional regulator, partial [Clostridium sp.]|nr:transcriptional regulator [Clostridium sp.]